MTGQGTCQQRCSEKWQGGAVLLVITVTENVEKQMNSEQTCPALF